MSRKSISLFFFFLLVTIIASTHASSEALERRSSQITGHLYDAANGLGIAGEVAASYIQDGTVKFRHVFSDGNGYFVIENLPVSEIQIVTKVDGYEVKRRSVTIDFETMGGVDFSLRKQKTIRGVVSDNHGQRVSRATVRIVGQNLPEDGHQLITSYSWETSEMQTNAQGEFSLNVPPARSFMVEASHPNFMPTILAPQELPSNQNEFFMNLRLLHGGSISGRVVDANLRPITGARLQLIGGAGRPRIPGFVSTELLQAQVKSSISLADGSFAFHNIIPSRRKLIVSHPLFGQVAKVIDLGPGSNVSDFQVIVN